jgi:DNA primase
VNKVIRDKMTKEEFKSTKTNFSEIENPTPSNDNIDQLLYKDEQHEQALVRCLLEFGLMEWDNETVVADFIFNQIDESDLSDFFDNQLLIEIIKMYRKWFQEDLKPNSKTFLYLEDKQISDVVMNLMHVELEISPNWKEYYDGHIPTREELYKEEVFSIVNYLQLRKTRRLILQNQLELENSKNIEDQLILIQTHQHLKNIEIELTKKIGTVIIK